MREIVAGILGIILMTGASYAADRPVAPPVPPVDALSAPAVSARFARTFTIGQLDSAFSGIALGDLRKTLGTGAVASIQGMSWLCYDLPAAGQRFWLSSGSASKVLETVTVTNIGPPSSQCPVLAKTTSVAMDGGIRIGMSKAELIKRLGPASRQLDTWLVYSAQQSGGRQGLAVQFINNKAVFIAISHIDR